MARPYNPNDKLMHRAHNEGFRARSVYKLQELDQKFKLLKPGMHVLDLGASPGSWLQYSSQIIGDEGKALGIDLKPIYPVSNNVKTVVGDITDIPLITQLINQHLDGTVDIIISDLAPNTTGVYYVDQLRSVELNIAVFNLAKEFLKPGRKLENGLLLPKGKLIMKVFPGEHFDKFLKEVKKHFKNVHVTKASASRDSSREVYVVCS